MAVPASALSLLEAYDAALANDPKYLAALYDNAAGQENAAIGLASLLPNVAATYNYTDNNGELNNSPRDYIGKVANLSMRQPLLNLDSWHRYKGGQSQALFSEAKFESEAQDLILRIATAYLDSLLAQDQLRLSTAQQDAYRENQIANQQMFDKGAGTRTDMLETRARYQLAEAAVVEARDNLAQRLDELSVIIGRQPGVLDEMVISLPQFPVEPSTLTEWEDLARAHHPEIRAQLHSLDYAKAEVERNRAGHLPRVDLVASHSRSVSETIQYAGFSTAVTSVGVQVSVPLYSGGGVNAQVRQAVSKVSSSRAGYDSSVQKILVDLRKQFQLTKSTRIKISATEAAERSAAEAVEATRKSIAGGQRVNLDLLNAMQQLYTTRRDLSEAKHAYLLAYLRLHAAAGLLERKILYKVSSCFGSQAD